MGSAAAVRIPPAGPPQGLPGGDVVALAAAVPIEEMWLRAGLSALKSASRAAAAAGVPMSEAVQSPVVRKGFHLRYARAGTRSRDRVVAAWESGKRAGRAEARALLDQMGVPQPGSGYVTGPVRDAVLQDVARNAASAEERLAEALAAGGPDAGSKVVRDLARRAKFSVEMAESRGRSLAAEQIYKQAGLRKMWVARLDGRTCSFCRALHGEVRQTGEEFTADPSLRSYGPLLGPPRHPNCRCYLIPVKPEAAPPQAEVAVPFPAGAKSPAQAVQAVVKTGADLLKGMMDGLVPLPDSLSSVDLRDLPGDLQKKFAGFVMGKLFGKG